MKLKQIASYVREHGLRSSAVLTVDRLLKRQAPEIPYEIWLGRNRPSSHDYTKMEKTLPARSILIGVTAAMPQRDRTAFVQSLEMQVYHHFRALKNCEDAQYVLIVNGPCTLRPDLLWECVSLLNQERGDRIDLIYFDSDWIGEDGKKGDPAFRPDFDPDLLEQVNYMGNVVLVRYSVMKEAGGVPDGDVEYDAFLRRVCLREKAAPLANECMRVRHIPKILYHAAGEYPKGGSADSLQSSNESGEASLPDDSLSGQEPLISVLIPNKDHSEDLRQCVESLLHVNTWKNLEILILENHSTEKATFDLYRQLEEADSRIRILTWDAPFNYSAVNNFGAEQARGTYLLLLNNDTRILAPDSVKQMEALASRPQTGAVGALLLYPDGHVQHAGIILGHGGVAGHAWQGELPRAVNAGYPGLVFSHTHNVCAVTGACMMLRKEVWDAAGGMDPVFGVTFNDVDLCMRIRRGGLRILICPEACLEHDESLSRGAEDSPEKVERFHAEISAFVKRWGKELEDGDPFYNPCLTLTGRSWTCKDDLRETVKPYLKYAAMFQEMRD